MDKPLSYYYMASCSSFLPLKPGKNGAYVRHMIAASELANTRPDDLGPSMKICWIY